MLLINGYYENMENLHIFPMYAAQNISIIWARFLSRPILKVS